MNQKEKGRTGLTSIVTASLFAVSVFFFPLLQVVGGRFDAGDGVTLYPTLAPALILVGVFMMVSVGKIDWSAPHQAIPAFLTAIMMPLTTSMNAPTFSPRTSGVYFASARSSPWSS